MRWRYHLYKHHQLIVFFRVRWYTLVNKSILFHICHYTDTLALCITHNGYSWSVMCHDNHIDLTRWVRDKMAPILQTMFLKSIFLNENVSISVKISLKFVPNESNWQDTNIGSDNGLTPSRPQAIIGTNDDYSTDTYMLKLQSHMYCNLSATALWLKNSCNQCNQCNQCAITNCIFRLQINRRLVGDNYSLKIGDRSATGGRLIANWLEMGCDWSATRWRLVGDRSAMSWRLTIVV